MAELSVLIVNYNTWRECAQAIASLRQHGPTRPDGAPLPFECIVVDNHSPHRPPAAIAAVEQQLALLAEQQGDPAAGRLILNGENAGYSRGMNLAFEHSRGRWILVSNPDLLFGPGLITKLQRHLEQDPRAGIAVPKGYWDSGFQGHLPPNTLPTLGDAWITAVAEFSRRLSRWHARRLLRSWQRVWTAERPLALPMMSGCLFLIEREFFVALGRFDERYPLYYEDADLSVAIRRAGRTVAQVPDAELVHFVNRSGMSDLKTMWQRHYESRAAYYRKWYGWRGVATLWATRWLVQTPLLARLRRFRPEEPFVDLGSRVERPVLRLPRSCRRFLVLMSLDPRFYLAAGTYGDGDCWSPSDQAFALFVHATYFFAVFDLDGGGASHLGTWRYRCLSHLGQAVAEPPAPPAPPAVPVEATGPAEPVLSVVVLSWNTRDLTLACLRALFAETARHSREVIVVDNGSSDGSADAIAEAFPQVRLLRNAENRLYAAGNNQGVAIARGAFVCTLNSDTEVRPGALDLLVDWLVDRPDYGAAAPRLVDPDGTVQRACHRFPRLLTALCFDSWWGTFWPGSAIVDRYLMRDFDHLTARDVDQPPGACCVLRTAEWRELGGFDERLALFYNDVDLCRRLWHRRRRIRYVAAAEVLHHRGASTRNFARMLVLWHRDRIAYYRKHWGLVGRVWVALCVRLRIWEEWWQIGRRNRHDPGRRRAERDHLAAAVKELRAS